MLKFSLIGDSNIKRHLSQHNCRGRPPMASAELKMCQRLDLFGEALRSIRAESNVCLVSCLTNFLTSSEDPSSSVSLRVEPVLLAVRDFLLNFCQEQPERHWLLAPPMYRTTPLWYMDGLAEIMIKFSAVMSFERPSNLIMLPSFPCSDLESDGVHLTPYSGSEFVLHLFDSAENLIKNLKLSSSALIGLQSESIRSLKDRVSVIEQDHKRLNQSVEGRVLISSESADFYENQRYV